MKRQPKFLIFIALLASIVVLVGGTTTGLLYNAAFRQAEEFLSELAKNWKRLAESVERFDAEQSRDFPGGATQATLSQIYAAHKEIGGFGKSGEFLLVRRSGGQVLFAVSGDHIELSETGTLTQDPQLAQPVLRALEGGSGVLVGVDYRGVRVLAAHEYVPTLKLGIVAKIDLTEIRWPYIKAFLFTLVFAAITIVLGAVMLAWIFGYYARSLEMSSNLLKAAIDALPIWITVKDTNLKYTMANEQVLKDSGLTLEQFQQQNITTLSFGTVEERADLEKMDKTVLESGEAFTVPEMPYTLPDGTVRFYHQIKVPFRNGRGDIQGIVSASMDITQRREIEVMKNDFISVVSHELRTPLTSIIGALGLLAGGVAGELPSKARDMIGIAKNNAERLSRLIGDILDLAKIEEGNQEFQIEVIDVRQLLEDAASGNSGLAEEHSVTFVVKSLPAAITIKGSRDGLIQVLTNLLSNAAKFSPQGGEVELAVERINQGIRISVMDHGPGVPWEAQERIFEKFVQADTSDSRSKYGTGLGLSISKSIVEQHGGKIGVKSQPGHGATFFFDLPETEFSCIPVSTGAEAGGRAGRD